MDEVFPRFPVAEEHGGGRAESGLVGRFDNGLPLGGPELIGRKLVAHGVIEDFGGRSRNRSETGIAQATEHRAGIQTALAAQRMDLHGRIGVEMNARQGALQRSKQLLVVLQPEVRVDAALQANLGDPRRLQHALHHRPDSPGVGLGVTWWAVESAKGTVCGADVGEVGVAVDDIGHDLAMKTAVQGIGRLADFLARRAIGLGQFQGFVHRQGLAAQGPGQWFGGCLGTLRFGHGVNGSGRTEPSPAVPSLNDCGDSGGNPALLDIRVIHRPPVAQFGALTLTGLGVLFGRGPGVQGIDPIAVGANAAQVVGPRQQGLPMWIDVGRDLDGHPRSHAAPVLDEFQILFQCGSFGHKAEPRSFVGDEVLEDDFLQVPVARVDFGQGIERAQPGLPRFTQSDEDATGVRHPGAAGGLQRLQAALGGFLRSDGPVEGVVDVFEHQAHGGIHFGQPLEVARRHGADVGVRQEAGFQGTLAGPANVCDEIIKAPGLQLGPQMRHGIRSLACEEQDLRGSALPCSDQEFLEARLEHEPLPIPPVPAVGTVPRTIPR